MIRLKVLKQKALYSIDKGIFEIEELMKSNSFEKNISQECLMVFISNLRKARPLINEDKDLADIDNYKSMGRIIVDSWPKNTKAGNAILDAERYIVDFYEERKKH